MSMVFTVRSTSQCLFAGSLKWHNSLPHTHTLTLPVQRWVFCLPCWAGRGWESLLSVRSCKQEVGGHITPEIQKPTSIWQCQTVARKPLLTSCSPDQSEEQVAIPPSTASETRYLISLKTKSPHPLYRKPGDTLKVDSAVFIMVPIPKYTTHIGYSTMQPVGPQQPGILILI